MSTSIADTAVSGNSFSAGNGDADGGGRQPPASPSLLDYHRHQLYASGLTDATIAAAGIYSETSPERNGEMLNWDGPANDLSACLVYPYFDAAGQTVLSRLKPDSPRIDPCGKPIKYESPRGASNRAYFPPGVREQVHPPGQTVLITEGEKKALALAQAGYAVIGLVGVYGWKRSRREQLIDELEEVDWNGRDVVIVFDSDVSSNPDVQHAEARLAGHLRQRGANVRAVRLPAGPVGDDGVPTKVGADDYIVANGVEAFAQLVDAAIEPEPPASMQIRRPAKELDPYPVAQRFIEQHSDDGVPLIRMWRGSWYEFHDGCYRELSEDESKTRVVGSLNCIATNVTRSVVADVLMHVRAEVHIPDDTEAPCWLPPHQDSWRVADCLMCRDQIVHLPSLIAREPAIIPTTPRLFATNALDFDFDPNAQQPLRWLRFLQQLWPDDPESIDLLQEWFGYSLTADTSQQKILMIIGPRRSGKGTIARVLTEVVGGQNVAGPTLSGLGQNFGLWPLLGKSVAIVSDARLSGRTDNAVVVERLLSISGEDALTVDRKHQQPVTGKLSTRLMILTNELPRFADSSGALSGRMLLLGLQQSWYGREDPRLLDRLRAEIPGILLWGIEGWRRLRERGHFVVPAASNALQMDLEDLTSPVGAFVRECCEVTPASEVPRTTLYARFQTWCQEQNILRIPPRNTFGRDLRAAVPGLGDGQRHGGERTYNGIGLREGEVS